MRIWDIKPEYLCRNHLLGEHRELHALWTILTQDKKGFRNHPETKRWVGKLKALYLRHNFLVDEMKSRNYIHKTPLEKSLAKGIAKQNKYLQTAKKQKDILKNRCSFCFNAKN